MTTKKRYWTGTSEKLRACTGTNIELRWGRINTLIISTGEDERRDPPASHYREWVCLRMLRFMQDHVLSWLDGVPYVIALSRPPTTCPP